MLRALSQRLLLPLRSRCDHRLPLLLSPCQSSSVSTSPLLFAGVNAVATQRFFSSPAAAAVAVEEADDVPVAASMPVADDDDAASKIVRRLLQKQHAAHAAIQFPVNEIRVVSVTRVTKVLPGGRMMSVNAVVVGGNGHGLAGYGFAKGEDSETAVERACLKLFRNLRFVERYKERTITHPVSAEYVETEVKLWPAKPAAGVRAHRAIAAIAAVTGIPDLTAKISGSRRSDYNVVKATFQALGKLEAIEDTSRRRGVRVMDVTGVAPEERPSARTQPKATRPAV